MDRHTKEQRSKNMRAVKSKGSKIEKLLAKSLWNKGHRYRKNYAKVPGKPDIAFVGLKIAVFCDSEFWHGKDWDTKRHEIKSNQDFWYKKIEGNIRRDKEVNQLLKDQGWQVIRFWGKEIEKNTEICLKKIEKVIEKKKMDRKFMRGRISRQPSGHTV